MPAPPTGRSRSSLRGVAMGVPQAPSCPGKAPALPAPSVPSFQRPFGPSPLKGYAHSGRPAGAMAQSFDEALELVGNEFEGLDEPGSIAMPLSVCSSSIPCSGWGCWERTSATCSCRCFARSFRRPWPRAGTYSIWGGRRADLRLARRLQRLAGRPAPPQGGHGDSRRFRGDRRRRDAGAARRKRRPRPRSPSPLLLHRPAGRFRSHGALSQAGGVLCVVVADEIEGYTGRAVQSFIDAGGDTGDNDGHLAAIAERQRLLAGDLLEVLREGAAAALVRAGHPVTTQPPLRPRAVRPDRPVQHLRAFPGRRYREVRGRLRPAPQRPGSGRPAHRGGGAAQGDVEGRPAAAPLHRPARRQGSGRSR